MGIFKPDVKSICLYTEELEPIEEVMLFAGDPFSPKSKKVISVHFDYSTSQPGFLNDPYLKVGDNSDWKNVSNSIRIYIKNNEYGYNHSDGKGSLKFTTDLGRKLNAIMEYPCKQDPNLTVWEYIIATLNNLSKYINLNEKPYVPPIVHPDFTKAKEKSNLKRKGEFNRK